MIDPTVIDALLKSGITAEQLAAAVKADALVQLELAAAKREKERIRKREQRAKNKPAESTDVSHGHRGTPRDTADAPLARVEDKTSNSEIEPQGSKGVAKARPTRLPDNFEMPDEWGTWAINRGLPPERVPIEFQKLCNWAANAGSKGAKSNWFRAWQNWVIEAIDKLPRNRGPTVNGQGPTMAQVFGMVREKAAEHGQERTGGGSFREAIRDLPVLRRAQ